MKFYVISFALLINACTVLKDGGSTSVRKSNEQNKFKIPSYDLTVGLKDVIWEDSSIVTFISIHPDCLSTPWGDYRGRLKIGSNLDTCSIYPVKYDWKSQSGYFLIDDFNDIVDSFVYFSYQVKDNRYYQQNDQIYQSGSWVLRTELVKYADSLTRRSEKIYATKEWFSMWCEEHPAYQRLRLMSNH